MKGLNTKIACLKKACQDCQGCHSQQAMKDAANDLDEWAMAADTAITVTADDFASLDKAIEISTLAG